MKSEKARARQRHWRAFYSEKKENNEGYPLQEMLNELHDRSLGYAFGGPTKSWCDPVDPLNGLSLPVNAANPGSEAKHFTGCRKYQTCNLVPVDLKWKPWEQMTFLEKQEMKKLSCYRATRGHWDNDTNSLVENPGSWWDANALESRNSSNTDAHWYANPFGVRTKKIGDILNLDSGKSDEHDDFSTHRDAAPCKIGGCLTPEMQRDIYFERLSKEDELSGTGEQENQAETRRLSLQESMACPYYFRHTDESLRYVRPNPQRFTQCFITLPENIEMLREKRLIAAAPIFRTLGDNFLDHSSYWYSFYSGFSFLQFPPIEPTQEGWDQIPFALRWQATTISRQNINVTTKEPPITHLFSSVKTGENLSTYEKQYRMFCYSDGYTSVMLLQWIICRRLKAALKRRQKTSDITGQLEWLFEAASKDNGLLSKLEELGYDLKKMFSLKADQNSNYYRTSTLAEDLYLLGLTYEGGKLTRRFNFCISWLACRFSTEPAIKSRLAEDLGRENFKAFFDPLSPGIKNLLTRNRMQQLPAFCQLLIDAPFLDTHNQFVFDNNTGLISFKDPDAAHEAVIRYETNILMKVCQLLPKVHIIVRAYGSSPVRWIFIPTSYEADTVSAVTETPKPEIFSGAILLVEDVNGSALYDYEVLERNEDVVFERLKKIMPLLVNVVGIEEENIRENLIKSRALLDFHKREAGPMGHYLKSLRSELEKHDEEALAVVYHMLNYLERRYRLMAEINSHFQETKKVTFDCAKAATEARKNVLDFYKAMRFKTEKDVTIRFEVSRPTIMAQITTITGYYDKDDDEYDVDVFDDVKTAANDFKILLADLLFQRISIGETSLEVTLSERFGDYGGPLIDLTVFIDDVFHKRNFWSYPAEPLEFWPFGRGFHSTFLRAKNLGAPFMQVGNEGKRGFIKISFEGGES